MSDDGYRHDHLPTAGEQNFEENGSETMENDQTGLPSWAAALTAQLHASFAAQLTQMREEQDTWPPPISKENPAIYFLHKPPPRRGQ